MNFGFLVYTIALSLSTSTDVCRCVRRTLGTACLNWLLVASNHVFSGDISVLGCVSAGQLSRWVCLFI